MINDYAWKILREQTPPEQMEAIYQAAETDPNWDVPADVKKQAKAKWDALPPEEQTAAIQTAQSEFELFEKEVKLFEEEIKNTAFMSSFKPIDLLWFGLAIVTAFQTAARKGDE